MAVDYFELIQQAGILSLDPVQPFPIERVWTDTRSSKPGDLFVALCGQKHDAHDFIAQAFDQGCRNFVVSNTQKIPAHLKAQANFFVAPDTLWAYGDLAKAYLEQFHLPVVAITGSVGKTTTKEMLAHVLAPYFCVHKNQGTENNWVGVPKTIFSLEAKHNLLILELGTNAPGEIQRLSSIANPSIAVITGIGCSHLEKLGSLEGVFREKISIADGLRPGGALIVNADDPFLSSSSVSQSRVVRVGLSKNSALHAKMVEAPTLELELSSGLRIPTALNGRHFATNVLLCVQVSTELGVSQQEVGVRFKDFLGVAGRFQIKNLNGITFIDDSYNANPSSFEAALETLRQMPSRGKKGVVCGDMLELGAFSERLHEQLGQSISKAQPAFVIVCGKFHQNIMNGLLREKFDKQSVYVAIDSAQAGQICHSLVDAGDLVLVKGSRMMRMEKVCECFTSGFIH